MKQIFLGYFLIVTFHNANSMEKLVDTPEKRQKLRNQIAFEYICTNGINRFNEQLIDDGSIDFNFPYGDFQRTQLSIAARSGNILTLVGPTYNPKTIEWLIDHRADPHILDNTGRSAALWSIGSFQGKQEHPIVLFFKKNPVDINQVFNITNIGDQFQIYKPKVTLLTAAVLTTWQVYGNPQARYNLVRTLLEFKPNRNIAPNGKTALQIAEELDDQEMIKILEEKQ
jgi:ankyrin repeat protein